MKGKLGITMILGFGRGRCKLRLGMKLEVCHHLVWVFLIAVPFGDEKGGREDRISVGRES